MRDAYNANDGYFNWLVDQIEYFDMRGEKDKLLRKLFEMPFYYVIRNDKNRAGDGIALRNEYFGYPENNPLQPPTIDTQCSVLEFLVALAKRMNYIYASFDENRVADMFWEMMRNIDLEAMYDDVYEELGGDATVEDKISDVLERLIYDDGRGGLFPLENPRENQRNVEFWYQMNQYLREKMAKEGRI